MFFKRNKNQVGGSPYQHVSADTAKNLKLDTAELVKSINELKDATVTAFSSPSQNIDVQYIEKDVKNDWPVKHYTESALDYKDDSELSKSHVNDDMAVNVKLDTADAIKSINDLKEVLNGITDHPKIHELSNQSLVIYASGRSIKYVWHSSDREIVELLNKPNTRLAIIEDDEDA